MTTSISRYNPAREFVTLREAMNRLFEDSFVNGLDRNGGSDERAWRLPVEAYVTEGDIVVRAAVPGLKPSDVDITIEGDALTIKGEYPPLLENVTYLFTERPVGKFTRVLQLNVPVEADKAEATFENGLLTLTLPKAQAIRPKSIPVKAK